MWLRRTAFLFLVLAGCENESSDVCVEQQASYRVTVAVSMREPAKRADSQADVADPGRVLASVKESHSIVACHADVASQVNPGRDLVSNLPVYVDAAGFTLNVDSTLYPRLEIEVPALSVQLVLDENGNGRCDDGEPVGGAPMERAARSNVSVELVRGRCPVYL